MPVYRYEALDTTREDYAQSGTIIALSEEEARGKLRQLRFDRIAIKRVAGIASLYGRLTANVK
jgi:hypothetical protein